MNLDSIHNEVFLVEIFYDKGWKAYVDGVETPHVRLNYILRGLKVKSGKHEIIFKYDLPISVSYTHLTLQTIYSV